MREYDSTNILQLNQENGLRKYQCKKCKKIYIEPEEAGQCCYDL